MNKITEKAPAKLNFTLEVSNKRTDDYHDIFSIMQTVDLYDYITVKPSKNFEISSNCNQLNTQENIITKAFLEIKSLTGISENISVYLDKNIPISSGLGGGSSDAAALLRAINKLWELELSLSELISIGINIGSDVPFLITGGCAIVSGKGEVIQDLPRPDIGNIIIFSPIDLQFNNVDKTKNMFKNITDKHYSDGTKTKTLAEYIKQKKFNYSLLFNVFNLLTYNSDSELKLRSYINELGFKNIYLSGSGPSLYVFTENKNEENLYDIFKAYESIVTVNNVRAVEKINL